MKKRTFVVLTDQRYVLARGEVDEEEADIFLTWRADVGVCRQRLSHIEDALEISPTARRVEMAEQKKP